MANVDHEKERFASRLRANIPAQVVMAEFRLREVINGSPGLIVQVAAEDVRNLLIDYARLFEEWSRYGSGELSERPNARNMPTFVAGCMACEYPTPHRHA